MAEYIPTTEQQNIIETEASALVIAGPGTGKTRTAIEKARRCCACFDPTLRQKVLFLSFSNAAIRRLAGATEVIFSPQERRQLRFMTYHSYAAELLRLYGRFTGLPAKIQIMDTIEQALTCLEMSAVITDETKDEILHTLAVQGRLGFDVLIPLTISLLSNAPRLREIVTRYHPLVIVDEFQDTSEHQWCMLQLLGENSQVVAFGDPNQIIYSSLHGATVRRFDEFRTWKGIEPAGFSRRNFRCDQMAILDFAESLLTAKSYKPTEKCGIEIVQLQYRSELRSVIALTWKAIQEQGGSNPTVGIIVPSNTVADDIAVALRTPPAGTRVKFCVFARLIADGASYDSIILALLALRDHAILNTVVSLRKFAMALHAMDIHWNKRKKMSLIKLNQLEKSLVKAMIDHSSPISLIAQRLPSISDFNKVIPEFIAALASLTDLTVSCHRIASHGRLPLPKISAGDQLELFDFVRQSRAPKGLEGQETGHARTEIITYHRAKGREFDFVLMVVDPRSESTKPPIDESRRLYYVCATRAKKWLGVICYRNDLGRVLGPVLTPAQ